MIYESHYWKSDLLRSASLLRSRVAQKRWHPATFASVEREVMIGFYSLRKLIDASKIDDRTASQRVPVTVYPSTGKRVTRTNWTHWWELYKLEEPTSAELELLLLCHQFVHSYVFSCEFSETREFIGVLVSSDREKNRKLYSVSVPDIARAFESAGSSYPNHVRMTFNARKGDYDIVSMVDGTPHCSHD